MEWFKMVFRLIPMVTKLMVIAENAFDDVPESGEQKKQMVLDAVKAVFDAILGLSTGGQQETWSKIEPVLSSIIDAVCGFIFKK
jgi:hypothetical protein